MTTLTTPQAQMLSLIEDESNTVREGREAGWLINGRDATPGELRVIKALFAKKVITSHIKRIRIHGRTDLVAVRALVIR
jgi:hypothetical protein